MINSRQEVLKSFKFETTGNNSLDKLHKVILIVHSQRTFTMLHRFHFSLENKGLQRQS